MGICRLALVGRELISETNHQINYITKFIHILTMSSMNTIDYTKYYTGHSGSRYNDII